MSTKENPAIWVTDIAAAKTPLRFILAISKPYKWWAGSAMLLVGLGDLLNAITPIFYRNIVDSITSVTAGTQTYYAVYFWVLAYCAIFAAGAFTWRISEFPSAHWSAGVRVTGRYALTNYLLKHSNHYFSDRFAGSVANKINHARDGARSVVESILFSFWPLLITFVVSFVVAFTTNHWLGYIFAAWFGVALPVNIFFAKRRTAYSMLVTEKETELRGRTVDIVGNIRAVQEFARIPFEMDALKPKILEHKKAAIANWLYGEKAVAINTAIQIVFMVGMLLTAIYLASRGMITLGSVILVLSMINSVGNSIFYIGSQMSNIAEQWGEIKSGLDDLLTPYDVVDVKNAKPIEVKNGEIVFDHATFLYAEGNGSVLNDFSLTIPAGQKVGLVGRSGAGKSTLIKLLLRHYDLTGGAVEIDGQNIAEATQDSVRESIAVVPQEALLFHRSIKENIAYGKKDATEIEIIRAAELAQAHEFVESLPKKYDTLVGERGVKLSGGERQRVALARAILKPAKILVLDEATASLDSESEAAIQEALHTLMQGKTVIAIAHRLSTLREMDRIIVLDKGKIIEDGTHDSLLKSGGLYSELWAHQSGGYLQDEEE
jgi:ATP-binding cassette subfamily B protein